MRIHLSKLSSLRKIAFSRDSYKNSIRVLDLPSAAYYEDKLFQVEGSNNQDKTWERIHCQRMLAEANTYVSMMPKLEWLYFGQLPMLVTVLPETGHRTAISLSKERDDCWTLLQNMFGFEVLGTGR